MPVSKSKTESKAIRTDQTKAVIFFIFSLQKIHFRTGLILNFLDMAKAKSKKNVSGGATEQVISSNASSMSVCDWLNIIWNVIGVLAALGLAYHHMWYCYIQHENEMWFTNIKEVEREISFRTESGLYYSYFKQTVQGNTFIDQRSKALGPRVNRSVDK